MFSETHLIKCISSLGRNFYINLLSQVSKFLHCRRQLRIISIERRVMPSGRGSLKDGPPLSDSGGFFPRVVAEDLVLEPLKFEPKELSNLETLEYSSYQGSEMHTVT